MNKGDGKNEVMFLCLLMKINKSKQLAKCAATDLLLVMETVNSPLLGSVAVRSFHTTHPGRMVYVQS